MEHLGTFFSSGAGQLKSEGEMRQHYDTEHDKDRESLSVFHAVNVTSRQIQRTK